MSDLIDRQAALNVLHGYFDGMLETDMVYPKDLYNEIEALPSAQPECEDAVSRFEVLRLIDYSSHDLNDAVDNRYMQNEIKQLPSVTPKQPGWIPVTERLPKKDGDYLVTTHSGQIARYIFIGGSSEEYWRRCATAWVPLPKPAKIEG